MQSYRRLVSSAETAQKAKHAAENEWKMRSVPILSICCLVDRVNDCALAMLQTA